MSQSCLIALVLVPGTLLVDMPATHHEFVSGGGGGTENPKGKAGLAWHGIKNALAAQLAGVSRTFEVASS